MSSAENRRKKTVLGVSDFEEERAKTKKSLPGLLFVFVLGTLMIQCFNLVYSNIGTALHVSAGSASLLSTLPGIILAVVCMMYETLCDFISPKRMVLWGVGALIVSSVVGFCFSSSFWVVLIVRAIQVAGAQVAGSVFLVMTVKYLTAKEKAIYLGLFNAAYYLAAALGVFAGGWINNIPWRWLLLIPALSIIVFPILIRDTPDVSGKGEKVDIFGIFVFALIAACVAVYFSFMNFWWLIIVFVVLVIVFAFYITHGSNPFITVAFLKNKSYMVFILILCVGFFFEYAATPIYQVIGEGIFHMSLQQVSDCLTLVNIIAMIIGIVSGPIVNKLGRWKTILISESAIVIGFIFSALFIQSSFWFLTILNILIVGGWTAIYTPIYDGASAAVPQAEGGRSIGICDLTVNTAPAIGIAVYSAIIDNPHFGLRGLFGVTGSSAISTSNMFWIMAAVGLVTVIIIIASRRLITATEKKTQ